MNKRILSVIMAIILLFSNCSYAEDAKGAQETISLDFKGMDIVDVLKLLAQRGNMNIAISKNVRGKVTMFLKDVDVYDAFLMILASNDLAYEQTGNIINVMTEKGYESKFGQKFDDKRIIETFQLKHANANDVSKTLAQIKTKIGKVIVDEGANMIVVMDSPATVLEAKNIVLALDKPVETRIFSLDYAKADDVKPKIEENLTKNIGSVQVDERTNKIFITDLTEKMTEIENLINVLDERTREVLIEAKIIEITLNDEFKYGVNWDRLLKVGSNAAGLAMGVNFTDVITGSILPAETSGISGGSFELGTLEEHDYHAMIEVLETVGKTEVLSSPRIVVINNEEASILVGTNQPYATTGTTVSETVSQTTQQVTYVDLGVKLHVTPTINTNGYITMKIKPEVSSKTGDYTITSEEGTTTRTTTVPIISTSEAETTVMLKDGNTILLAGLIRKRDEESEDKIPFLGDIPLIGQLFKNQQRGSSDNPERQELVIFLTPHIISGDTISPEVADYLTTTEPSKAEIKQPPEKKREMTHFWWQDSQTHSDSAMPMAIQPIQDLGLDTSSMSHRQYYNLLRNKVLEIAGQNYPRSNLQGDVYISFVVSSDGKLLGNPKVLAAKNESLKALAVKSVWEASPFPKFPKSIRKSAEKFKVLITYN